MGYDLHITRKENWFDEDGPPIAEDEWRRVIEEDPELQLDAETRCVMSDGEYVFASWNGEPGALGYYNGEITTKNPPESLVRKMVAIAQRLDAKVQGDDGEVYRPDGTAPRERKVVRRPGLLQRVKDWFGARRNAREWQAGVPAFKVGSRVKDSFGRRGSVTEIDRHAEHGAGRLSVRFDDGNEVCYALIAPGVELDGEPAAE
jgi:hypothetical protein